MINGLVEQREGVLCSYCESSNTSISIYDYGVDSETGYHDTNEVLVCEECGVKELL